MDASARRCRHLGPAAPATAPAVHVPPLLSGHEARRAGLPQRRRLHRHRQRRRLPARRPAGDGRRRCGARPTRSSWPAWRAGGVRARDRTSPGIDRHDVRRHRRGVDLHLSRGIVGAVVLPNRRGFAWASRTPDWWRTVLGTPRLFASPRAGGIRTAGAKSGPSLGCSPSSSLGEHHRSLIVAAAFGPWMATSGQFQMATNIARPRRSRFRARSSRERPRPTALEVGRSRCSARRLDLWSNRARRRASGPDSPSRRGREGRRRNSPP